MPFFSSSHNSGVSLVEGQVPRQHYVSPLAVNFEVWPELASSQVLTAASEAGWVRTPRVATAGTVFLTRLMPKVGVFTRLLLGLALTRVILTWPEGVTREALGS